MIKVVAIIIVIVQMFILGREALTYLLSGILILINIPYININVYLELLYICCFLVKNFTLNVCVYIFFKFTKIQKENLFYYTIFNILFHHIFTISHIFIAIFYLFRFYFLHMHCIYS